MSATISVWVVFTTWDGPSYRNPGDAPMAVIDSVHLAYETAKTEAERVFEYLEGLGNEGFSPVRENYDTWEFEVHVEDQKVQP